MPALKIVKKIGTNLKAAVRRSGRSRRKRRVVKARKFALKSNADWLSWACDPENRSWFFKEVNDVLSAFRTIEKTARKPLSQTSHVRPLRRRLLPKVITEIDRFSKAFDSLALKKATPDLEDLEDFPYGMGSASLKEGAKALLKIVQAIDQKKAAEYKTHAIFRK
ncbi:MAG: hypothetical protein ABH986_00710 [archaeon]